MLKQAFTDLMTLYAPDSSLVESAWEEIRREYSDPGRHYHTLRHLESMLEELAQVRDRVEDWETMLCAVFYHDIVYKVLRGDNEEKSAEFARKKLQSLHFPADKIPKCSVQILATKGHAAAGSGDTDLFTDADLSILGQSWNIYEEYLQQIRREYSVYPDLVYHPGRTKVLTHFLQMERIFKSEAFFGKYEAQARENIAKELKLLK